MRPEVRGNQVGQTLLGSPNSIVEAGLGSGVAINNHVHRRRSSCRACGGERLSMFLSLGDQPLANAFLATADEFLAEPRYPLDVYFCETCSLVQLVDVIDPEVLFRNYIYVTGTSETMAAHNAAYARTVVEF